MKAKRKLMVVLSVLLLWNTLSVFYVYAQEIPGSGDDSSFSESSTASVGSTEEESDYTVSNTDGESDYTLSNTEGEEESDYAVRNTKGETESDTGTSESSTESEFEIPLSPIPVIKTVVDLSEIWCSSGSIAGQVLCAANKQNSYSKENMEGYEAIGKVRYEYVIYCYDHENKVVDTISGKKMYQMVSDQKNKQEISSGQLFQAIQDASTDIFLKDSQDKGIEWYELAVMQEISFVQNQWQNEKDIMVSMAAQEQCTFILEVADGLRIGAIQTMYYQPDIQEFYTSNSTKEDNEVTYASFDKDSFIVKSDSHVPAGFHMKNSFTEITDQALMKSGNAVFTDVFANQNMYVSGNSEMTLEQCFADIIAAGSENRGRVEIIETVTETTKTSERIKTSETTKTSESTKTNETTKTGDGSTSGGSNQGSTNSSEKNKKTTEKETNKITEKSTGSTNTNTGQNLIDSLVDAQNKLNDQKSALAGLSNDTVKQNQSLLSDSLVGEANPSQKATSKPAKSLNSLVGASKSKELLLDGFKLNTGKVNMVPLIIGALVFTLILLHLVITQVMKKGNNYYIR